MSHGSPLPNLEIEFEKRRPWITSFIIDGRQYGGKLDLMNDQRVLQFFEAFQNVQTIIELGSLEGGHSFALASHQGVRRVLSIEGREANVEKARFVQGLLGIKNVEFVLGNLETMDLSVYGRFDAIFCVGLLYHLPEPWNLVRQFSNIFEFRLTPNDSDFPS